MAASMSTVFSIPDTAAALPSCEARATRRRRIGHEAGRALEILGHAIEYLSDEFANESGPLSAHKPHLEAVNLLMTLNRNVYFGCPEVPTLRERIHSFLHRLGV